MKNRNTSKKMSYNYDNEYYDDEPVKTKIIEKKRKNKNWKKEWDKVQNNYDDLEDFYK